MNPYGQPPIPWQIVPAHPRPYFFNPVTRVTQWEPPAPNDFELEPHVPVQITMPGHAAPGAASGIPMPDPDTEPERYAAWLEVTAHIESGDRNTASAARVLSSPMTAATPRPRRGHFSDESRRRSPTNRGDAAAATRTFLRRIAATPRPATRTFLRRIAAKPRPRR